MRWKFDYSENDAEIPESNYGKSIGGIDMSCAISSVRKEELKYLGYCELREIADVLKKALDDVKVELVIARAEILLKDGGDSE